MSARWFVELSAAWRSSLERSFYDDHDRKVNGSTPNLVSLLRPLSESGFVLLIAPPPLSRDRRIKLKNSSSCFNLYQNGLLIAIK